MKLYNCSCLGLLFFFLSIIFTVPVAGQFAPPQALGIDGVPIYFTVFDFDGDGDTDIVAYKDGGIVAFENQPEGNTQWIERKIDLQNISTSVHGVYKYEHADLNGDDLEDLVVFQAGAEDSFVAWFAYNSLTGDLEFRDKVGFFGYAECSDKFYHFEDFDQDGDLDILFSIGWDHHLVENLDGKGDLAMGSDLETSCTFLQANDFDHDGFIDYLDDKKVYTNDGNNNFSYSYGLNLEFGIMGRPHLLNDSVIVNHQEVSDDRFFVSEIAGNSVNLLNSQALNSRDRLFFHDFNHDGTKEMVIHNDAQEPYTFTYGELDLTTYLFDRNKWTYDGLKVYFIEAGDFNQDGLDDIIISRDEELFWLENISDQPSFTGFAYVDDNANNVHDEGESLIPNVRIISPQLPYNVYTNEEGEYTIYAPPGTYELEAISSDPNVQPVSGGKQTINLPAGGMVSDVNFGFVFLEAFEALDVNIFSNITRCDNAVRFSMVYENTGTINTGGQIVLTIDERTDFISAMQAPIEVADKIIKWDFAELSPYEKGKIEFILQMPSAAFISDTLSFSAVVQNQVTGYSKMDTYQSLLRCSFDPNDKQVDPIGYGPDHLTLMAEDELEYLVRFQNTGNDTAFNIRITDELHPLLNVNTFRVVSASHRYRAEIEDRMLTFYFDDILLPDSTTDLTGSQGYVLFRVNALPELEEGAQITNQANIYFDRNEAIVTNEVVNTFVSYICTELRAEIQHIICAGDTFEGYASSGTYVDQFTTFNGCDSTRTLILTVNDKISTNISREICAGENAEGYDASGTYTDTFTAANGCDSTRTLVLTVKDNISTTINREICPGGNVEGYDASGTYTDTFTAANGCDSIRTLVLTVNDKISTNISREICAGENAEGYDASGTYTDTFTAANGCDSIRTLVLTVNDKISTTISREICAGGNVEGYDASGTYTDTFTAASGCDSIRTLVLTVNDNISTTISREICAGGNVEGYNASGTYTDTFTAASGCDSIRTLQLMVLIPVNTTIESEICEGESLSGYSVPGTYTDTFTGSNGCDSTRTLVLRLLPVYRSTLNITICDETLQGPPITTTETSTLVANNGCDSIVTINYRRIPLETIAVDTAICTGDSLYGYGEAGLYVDTLYNSGTCGTIRTLQLNVLEAGDAQCLVPTLDPEAFGIQIFPNPVQQLLTVRFDDHLNERVQVRLLDLRGRTIMEEEHLTRSNLLLDLSSLPGGMYLLELNRGRHSTVQKVIKME